jgi:hypothetical protein
MLMGLSLLSQVHGEVAADPAAAAPSPAAAVIAAGVAKLPAPGFDLVPGGALLGVTTSSPVAQKHVNAGISLLHAGWDFEAYRHFCAALGEDPDCLMAYWGVSLALSRRDPEFGAQQAAALKQMLALAQAGVGTELERGYAFCLATIFADGPRPAAEAFQKLAVKFPNETQAKLFSAILGRGGYNDLGMPTPDQLRAEQSLRDLLAASPDDRQLLNAYLTIHAEAPDVSASVVLARKLASLSPEFPPYQHMLGHYEARAGQHAAAAAAFGKAVAGYADYMQVSGVEVYDCPGWVRSRLCQIDAMHAGGAEDAALKSAAELAGMKVEAPRAFSAGGGLLLWEAKTLPARLELAAAGKGAAARALKALPPVAEVKAMKNPTAALVFYQGLAIYAEARVAIDGGKLERASQLAEALAQTGTHFSGMGETASGQNARSSWIRAIRGLEAFNAELRGLIAMAGPESQRGSAFNWFRSAADRDAPATLTMPQLIPYPLALRLVEYHGARVTRHPEALAGALAAADEALAARPRNLAVLRAQQAALSAAKDPRAAEVGALLKEIAAEK